MDLTWIHVSHWKVLRVDFILLWGFLQKISWYHTEGSNDLCRKDVKEIGTDLILGTNQAFAWRVWKEYKNRQSQQATRTGTRNLCIKLQGWESPVELWWHTVTHGRGSEGETGEWSG